MRERAGFHKRAYDAISNPILQLALDENAIRRRANWREVFASLPDAEGTRQRARAVRLEVIEHLDQYLEQFISQVQGHGIEVHQAVNAQHARDIIIQLLKERQVKTVAKSKSMVTEEIDLNQGLKSGGIRVVETDLGEFILQLRHERPSHIIVPAIHLRKEEVSDTFQEILGMEATCDIRRMNDTARASLREEFFSADAGITGVNFGVAETGTLCLVTNEGNGRMLTNIPALHIAVMGMERLVPAVKDLVLMLQLLPRSATGQKLTSYISLINRPRGDHDPDGPEERHLVIVDNERGTIRTSPLAESLLCIRCGACLNACPVYQELGGHPYNSVYPGPIGSLVSPGLFGIQDYGHLSKASTLCGACREVCPVQIDFPALLLHTRKKYVEAVKQPLWMVLAMKLITWIMTASQRYRLAIRLAALAMRLFPKKLGWLTWFPPPLSSWTKVRHFPSLTIKPFRERLNKTQVVDEIRFFYQGGGIETSEGVSRNEFPTLLEQFERELLALGGELIRCDSDSLSKLLLRRLQALDVDWILAWGVEIPLFRIIQRVLDQAGIKIVTKYLPREGYQRRSEIQKLAECRVGITGASAAFADTGTLVIPGGSGCSGLASLLPNVHIAILDEKTIYQDMSAWVQAGGNAVIEGAPYTTIISGPSRTADIEMELTLGVHGPSHVLVFCYKEGAENN